MAEWFRGHVTIGALLDQKVADAEQVFISEHDDEIRRMEEGSRPPEDHLTAFKKYVDEHANEIPALLAVTQRPKELTRQVGGGSEYR